MRLRALVFLFVTLVPAVLLLACTPPSVTSTGTASDEAYPHRYDGAGGGGGGGGGM